MMMMMMMMHTHAHAHTRILLRRALFLWRAPAHVRRLTLALVHHAGEMCRGVHGKSKAHVCRATRELQHARLPLVHCGPHVQQERLAAPPQTGPKRQPQEEGGAIDGHRRSWRRHITLFLLCWRCVCLRGSIVLLPLVRLACRGATTGATTTTVVGPRLASPLNLLLLTLLGGGRGDDGCIGRLARRSRR